ncbi:MAG TPA: TRAP transporter small permease [Rectinemataceae bacterium]
MKKILNLIAKIQLLVASVLFFVIFLANILEIVSRSAFNRSFPWVSDLSVICVVWMICLAMAACIHYREHLFMDFLVKKLPAALQKGVNLVVSSVALAFFIMLFITGIRTAATKTSLIFPSTQWPLVLSFAALPVFAFFSAVFMIPRLVEIAQGKDPHEGVQLESLL